MSSETRLTILGTARICRRIVPAIDDVEGLSLRAFASRDIERASVWSKEFGAESAFGSYQDAIDDPDTDAVYIALPPSMHHEWTIKAAEAGKHVLCEKPVAESATAAAEMIDACRQHTVQFLDGTMWYHTPRAADIRHHLQAGELGDIRHVSSATSFCWSEIPANDFRVQKSYGGGSLLDIGWYCIGAALWVYDEMPERAFGTARMRGDVDTHFTGLLWFPGHRMASIECGFDTARRRWLEIAGSQQSIFCDDFTRPFGDRDPRYVLRDGNGEIHERRSRPFSQEAAMLMAFRNRILNSATPDEFNRRALQTQQICEALLRSARDAAVVEVPGR